MRKKESLTPPLAPKPHPYPLSKGRGGLQGRGGIVYGFVQNTIPFANDSPPLKGRGRGGDCVFSISLYLLLFITDPTPSPSPTGAGRHRVLLISRQRINYRI